MGFVPAAVALQTASELFFAPLVACQNQMARALQADAMPTR